MPHSPASGSVSEAPSTILQATAIALEGRALAIEGPPGAGKSSLALALIERGAALIGDDGVTLTREGDALLTTPPPNIAGLLEVRGVGLVELPTAPPTPLALVLELGERAERLPEEVRLREILGVAVPVLPFEPGTIAPAERAIWALRKHGLPSG